MNDEDGLVPLWTLNRPVAPVWQREPATLHPNWLALPYAKRSWYDADEAPNARYFSAPLNEAPQVNAMAIAILRKWRTPTHIDFMLYPSEPSATWQILGSDSAQIEAILSGWLTLTHVTVSADPAAFLRSRTAGTIPRPPENHPRHRELHRLALRDGGWLCRYCRVGLIDICADDDIILDDAGRRMIDPKSPKALPTKDHLVPQHFGGSHRLPNLVLACRPCNSRKGAE